jgi:hypothetical protein
VDAGAAFTKAVDGMSIWMFILGDNFSAEASPENIRTQPTATKTTKILLVLIFLSS